MDLKSNPGKVMSETYSIKVPYFSHGLPYKWIQFLKTYEKVVKGQNLMSASNVQVHHDENVSPRQCPVCV